MDRERPSPRLCIFPSKPLYPRAGEVTPLSQAHEMMYPHLVIVGTRGPQPSQNISFLTGFYLSSPFGCVSLGHFLILQIVKIIFLESKHCKT